MDEPFYWMLIPTVFIGLLVIGGFAYEIVSKHVITPFQQAEKRRKANERFAELIEEHNSDPV